MNMHPDEMDSHRLQGENVVTTRKGRVRRALGEGFITRPYKVFVAGPATGATEERTV
jgi:hypothetical protein